MSAAVAGTGVKHLVHYSSRELLEWGKIPKQSEYSNALASVRQKTSVRTGKPVGLWYAYESLWMTHYKPEINARKNLSKSNKELQFQYKYVLPVPESKFTTRLEEDPSKILVLSLANFTEFLVRYEAPGIGASPWKYELKWYDFWTGLPRAYTRVPYDGFQRKFAGVEFSQDLVDYSADVFTVTPATQREPKKITITVDLPSGGTATVDVSFLQYLEVPSGCLFKPEALFDKPPSEYLVEGPPAAAGVATGSATARRGGTRRRRGRRLIRGRTRKSFRLSGYRS